MDCEPEDEVVSMTTNDWPLVHERDDGIRPAGPPDACLYCKQKVGQPHGRECVVVTKRIEMDVLVTWPDGMRPSRGVWQFDEPYSWDSGMSEFHKNESSWCCSNFLRDDRRFDVTWTDAPADVWQRLDALYEAGDCLCNVLRFGFAGVVDDTPKRIVLTEDEFARANVRRSEAS